MIDYIKGKLVELTPTEAIVECCGIGYRTLISLQTYEGLNGKDDVKVYEMQLPANYYRAEKLFLYDEADVLTFGKGEKLWRQPGCYLDK